MPYRTNLIYHYDGSYQGFLCCVAQCFQAKELPVDIRAQEDEQQSLFGRRDIPTRLDLAQRVERSIPRRISGISIKKSCPRCVRSCGKRFSGRKNDMMRRTLKVWEMWEKLLDLYLFLQQQPRR